MYSKRIIFFTALQIFHFLNKVDYVKKGKKYFFMSLCTTLPYVLKMEVKLLQNLKILNYGILSSKCYKCYDYGMSIVPRCNSEQHSL